MAVKFSMANFFAKKFKNSVKLKKNLLPVFKIQNEG
jgi:hypothetical protein